MQLNQNIFRANDIRGIAHEDLTQEVVQGLGAHEEGPQVRPQGRRHPGLRVHRGGAYGEVDG